MFRNVIQRPAISLVRQAALAVALWAATWTASHAVSTGNLIVDSSFEVNPLIPFAQILGPPFTTGAWGAEVGAIVGGPTDLINPASGLLMLQMNDDGLVATQSFQLVDATPYAAAINTGLVTVDAVALYNVPEAVRQAIASINVNFYDGGHNLLGGTATSSVVLPGGFVDFNVNTWQALNVTAFPVPVSTEFILLQAAYANASMIDVLGNQRAGYVDDARLRLNNVPEPSTFALLGLGVLAGLAARRRKKS